jgi:hypothetical protein
MLVSVFFQISGWLKKYNKIGKPGHFYLPTIFTFILLLSGCSGSGVKNYTSVDALATGGIAELSSSNGQVFIYRPVHLYMGGGIIWDVILNGEKIGRLGAGEYIVKHRRSGANEIMVEAEAWWTKWQSENIQFTADNNANNFFIVYSQQVGFAGSELVLREVPEKQWKSLLSK